MSAVVMALKSILTWLIPGQTYMESLLIVVICGAVGGLVYLLFVLTSGLASHILGDRIQRLPILGISKIKKRDVTRVTSLCFYFAY